jgi:dihydroorotate dehydrogenase electron transfer subunit
MTKSRIISAELLENENIAEGIYRMVLQIPPQEADFKSMNPGQFVNVYLEDRDTLLPRPISICMVKDDELHLIYKVVGKGTERMAQIKEGTQVRITTPLGNGYLCTPNKKVLLIAGGTGIPPMVALATRLKAINCRVTALLGYREEKFLTQDMKSCCDEIFFAMETENQDYQGNIVQLLQQGNYTAEECFACGPKGMLKEVNEYCLLKGMNLQVSLEERMGCGYGACLGCTVTIKDPDPVKRRVCKDGPVFSGNKVVWDE